MTCKNCGMEFEGRFCPKCGELAIEQPILNADTSAVQIPDVKKETLLDKLISLGITIAAVILWIRGAHYTSLILSLVATVISFLGHKLISDRKSVLNFGFQGIACVLMLISLGCWYRDYKCIKLVKTGSWSGYGFSVEDAIDYTFDSTSWRYYKDGNAKIVECN